MDTWVVHTLNGISFGMILFLLSMGLSLTLGSMGILNLTHGSFFMVGGFVGWTLVSVGGNFWIAALVGGVIAGFIGLVIERVFLHRLYKLLDDQVLLTMGLVSILGNIALWIYGGHARVIGTPRLLAFSIHIGDYSFPVYRLALIIIGVISFILLWWLIENTRAGMSIRAGMDDIELTSGLGINYPLICSAIFALGAFAGGFAGAVAAPLIGVAFYMPMDILLYALVIVVVGGPGSVLGTLIGALFIGIIDTFGKALFPDYAMFTIYVILIITLLFKPSGILGRARVQDEGYGRPESMGRHLRDKLIGKNLYIIIGLILIILPLILPSYLLSMLTKVLIFAIFAMSLNLIWGYTGLMSLGHAAFFGVGGYTVAILIKHCGIKSFWITAPCGIMVAGIFAAFFGFIAIRVSKIYFLLVTLALGQMTYYVTIALRPITGGWNGLPGIPRPDLGITSFSWSPISFYFFIFSAFLVCVFLFYRIVISPFGYALRGIRDNESRMQALGHTTWLAKYIAFIIAGIFAGAAGVFYSYFLGMVHPFHVEVTTSVVAVLMVIIGGTSVFIGPFLGAAVIVLLEYYVSLYLPERWPLILGCVFIISVMFLRGGIGLYLGSFCNMVSYRFKRIRCWMQ